MSIIQPARGEGRPGIESGPAGYGWTKHVTAEGCPFYLNEDTRVTQWVDPRLEALLLELNDKYRGIRFSAYRTAIKLRTLQNMTSLASIQISEVLTSLQLVEPVLMQQEDAMDGMIDSSRIADVLKQVLGRRPLNIEVIEVLISFFLTAFDRNRTGKIPLVWLKMALVCLSIGWYEEKLRALFAIFDCNHDGHMTLLELRSFIACIAYLTEPFDESYAFVPNGQSVTISIDECIAIEKALTGRSQTVSLETFILWGQSEPQCLKWLPTLHRLAVSEDSVHDATCHSCDQYPIKGFRYKKTTSVKGLSYCQICFWTGRGPAAIEVKEYCFQTSGSRDVKDFFGRIGTKAKRAFSRKKVRQPTSGSFSAPADIGPAPGPNHVSFAPSPTPSHSDLQTLTSTTPAGNFNSNNGNQEKPWIQNLGVDVDDELKTIEQLAKRTRQYDDATVSPLFRLGEGINAQQSQELLRTIDELKQRNVIMENELMQVQENTSSERYKGADIERLEEENRLLKEKLLEERKKRATLKKEEERKKAHDQLVEMGLELQQGFAGKTQKSATVQTYETMNPISQPLNSAKVATHSLSEYVNDVARLSQTERRELPQHADPVLNSLHRSSAASSRSLRVPGYRMSVGSLDEHSETLFQVQL